MDLLSAGLTLGGGLLGFLDAENQADAIREANAASGLQPWSGAVPYIDEYMQAAQDIYGQQGFAPIANPLELLGRANTLGYAEGALPGMIGAAQQSWMTGLDPGLNPYVGPMIEAAQQDLVQDYLRNVMPAIADRSQAVGGYGGSAQGVAEGIASEGLLEALGDVETNLLSNAYNQSQAQQRAAWGATPMMTNLGFLPSQTQQQVGGQYRADQMQPAANLTGYGAAMNPFFTLSPYQAQPVTHSPYGAALGGGLAGYQMGQAYGQMPGVGAAPLAAPLGVGVGGFPQNNFLVS